MPPVHEVAIIDLSGVNLTESAQAYVDEIASLIANEWEPFGLTNARLGFTRDRMLYPATDEIQYSYNDRGTLRWTVVEKDIWEPEQEGLSDEMIADLDP